MVPVKIFSTVGTTPQAVVNAISSHLLELGEGTKIDCYFLVGSSTYQASPSRKSEDMAEILDGFNINKKHFTHFDKLDIKLHASDPIDILEHDLVENVAIIVSEVDKLIIDGDRIIFDITGGRKVMTGSALLSIMILKQKKPNCSYEIAYYWLKKFTPENMNKKLFELGFDAYESIFTSLEEIDERVRMLRK